MEKNKENDIRLWDKLAEASSKLDDSNGVIDITNYEKVIPALAKQAIGRETIFIEHNELENMKSQLKKYFKDLPEPKFYYGKKIAKMEIVEKEDL